MIIVGKLNRRIYDDLHSRVPLKKWTPNYTAQGYVEIPDWHGVAGDVVEFDFVPLASNNQVLLDGTVAGQGQITISPRIVFSTYRDVTINGVATASGTFTPTLGEKYTFKGIASKSIGRIGIGYNSEWAFNGSITNIKLTKADGSDNRHYASIIESDSQPNTLILKDELCNVRPDVEVISASTYPSHYAPITKNKLQWQNGSTDGKMINFPANQEWKEYTYQLANGLWDMSNRELVSFTRSTPAWLDGVEYAPNKPRYKNGELLVEEQATNLIENKNRSIYGATASWSDSKKTLTVLATSNKCEFTQAIGNVGDKYCFSVTIKNKNTHTMSIQLRSQQSAGMGEYLSDVYEIQPSETIRSRVVFVVENTNIHWFGFLVKNGDSFELNEMQVEQGTVATSYIPTTTTAVTRAADIATVREWRDAAHA